MNLTLSWALWLRWKLWLLRRSDSSALAVSSDLSAMLQVHSSAWSVASALELGLSDTILHRVWASAVASEHSSASLSATGSWAQRSGETRALLGSEAETLLLSALALLLDLSAMSSVHRSASALAGVAAAESSGLAAAALRGLVRGSAVSVEDVSALLVAASASASGVGQLAAHSRALSDAVGLDLLALALASNLAAVLDVHVSALPLLLLRAAQLLGLGSALVGLNTHWDLAVSVKDSSASQVSLSESASLLGELEAHLVRVSCTRTDSLGTSLDGLSALAFSGDLSAVASVDSSASPVTSALSSGFGSALSSRRRLRSSARRVKHISASSVSSAKSSGQGLASSTRTSSAFGSGSAFAVRVDLSAMVLVDVSASSSQATSSALLDGVAGTAGLCDWASAVAVEYSSTSASSLVGSASHASQAQASLRSQSFTGRSQDVSRSLSERSSHNGVDCFTTKPSLGSSKGEFSFVTTSHLFALVFVLGAAECCDLASSASSLGQFTAARSASGQDGFSAKATRHANTSGVGFLRNLPTSKQ
jgi:hypothetical protein